MSEVSVTADIKEKKQGKKRNTGMKSDTSWNLTIRTQVVNYAFSIESVVYFEW